MHAQAVSQIPINWNRLSCNFHPVLPNEFLNQQLRIDKINWFAIQSQPDLSFDVKEQTIQVQDAKMLHLIAAYKLIFKLKISSSEIRFPNLVDLEKFVYTDASFAIFFKLARACGYFLFPVDSRENASLVNVSNVLLLGTSRWFGMLFSEVFCFKHIWDGKRTGQNCKDRSQESIWYSALNNSNNRKDCLVACWQKTVAWAERVANSEQYADVLTEDFS